MQENEIGTIVIGAAIDLHKNLGPGLLETVYEVIFANQLAKKGLNVQRQVSIPIEYEGDNLMKLLE
jgi:GxxExxY protein